MKLKARKIPIGTGDILIAVLNKEDATELDLKPADRILIKNKRKKAIATLDISKSSSKGKRGNKRKGLVLKRGEIGLFEELQRALNIKDHELVSITIENKPKSLSYIKKKMYGNKLNNKEIHEIIGDISKGKLSDVEITYFVAACFSHPMDTEEIVALTTAMVDTGEILKIKNKIIVDKHCIGGVAANRTSMIVVPIIAAVGLKMPKTSSRSITSAAGTSDTVEVLCSVEFGLNHIKKIVNKTNGCLIWGGSVNLAPTDDKIIRVEHPLSLDPEGQLLASILAKKKSVSATHVLIDIPVGKGAKIREMKRAKKLKKDFETIAKKIGLNIVVIITDGTEPIGNGVGPALEARDVIWTLENHKKGSELLREKSLKLAGILLESTKKAKKRKGYAMAKEILDSGKALKKFWEIVKAQGGRKIKAEKIRMAKRSFTVKSSKKGKVIHVDNKVANKISRIAGAPFDKEAGIYLYVHKGDKVKNGDKLFTIYSDSKERLQYAKEIGRKKDCVKIK